MENPDQQRTIFAITGADRVKFLQGLVSNVVPETENTLTYAAILTPQGKYLADFFMLATADAILIDVAHGIAADLMGRLNMYKLRADVQIEETDQHLTRGLGPLPDDALPDPRHVALGWRRYGSGPGPATDTDWDALRVANCIPETGIELIPNETYILEAGFERLNGVDFKKGCYVGQEVTARMKHKTELKKGLAIVSVSGSAPVGTEIFNDGKSAGVLFTQSNGQGIAYLRFARATGEMIAGEASLVYDNFENSKPS